MATGSDAQLRPRTSTSPEVGRMSPSRISTVVVLPAPLGPKRPKHSPTSISRSMPSTARTGPSRPGYCLRNSLTRMARSLMEGVSPGGFFPGSGPDGFSDYRAVGHNRRPGNDRHAVANHVRRGLFRVDDAGFVDDLDVATNPRILIGDGPFDDRISTYAGQRAPQLLALGDLAGLLVVIDTHDVRVADHRVLADHRPHADDG